MENARYWIDESLIIGGETLDRGFVLDTAAGGVEWREPIQNGEVKRFDIAECRYSDGTPVSPEDGELVGVPEEEYFELFQNKKALFNVCTISEASTIWDLDPSTLRHAIRDGRFQPHEYRKAGREWVLSRAAMVRLYGEEKKEDE